MVQQGQRRLVVRRRTFGKEQCLTISSTRTSGLVLLFLLAIISGGTGCRRTSLPGKAQPEEAVTAGGAQSRVVKQGIRFEEVALPRENGKAGKLWVYLPDPLPQKKIGCVVIAPAGTRLFHGIGLGEGDRAEHLPYARAGFAVVAYEIDGPLEGEQPIPGQVSDAGRAFVQADAGLANAQAALLYVATRLPMVDPNRLYVAGHSSAATLALTVAESEPTIRGCIAFSPCTDVEGRLGQDTLSELETSAPGMRSVLARTSPKNNAARLRCPLFLFHAKDDNNVPISESETFVSLVKQNNQLVKFVRAPSGGHYDGMISQGIPQAIQWLKALPTK